MTQVNECFSRLIPLLNQDYAENGILIVAGVVWGFEGWGGGVVWFFEFFGVMGLGFFFFFLSWIS